MKCMRGGDGSMRASGRVASSLRSRSLLSHRPEDPIQLRSTMSWGGIRPCWCGRSLMEGPTAIVVTSGNQPASP